MTTHTRNGAIGANWTVQQNGLNIASNQIQVRRLLNPTPLLER